MGKLTEDKLILNGKSGRHYHFSIYSINYECPSESGVYIFTKRELLGRHYNHELLYIGHAQSFQKMIHQSYKEDFILKQNANTLCLMEILSETDRINIQKDLLEANQTIE